MNNNNIFNFNKRASIKITINLLEDTCNFN